MLTKTYIKSLRNFRVKREYIGLSNEEKFNKIQELVLAEGGNVNEIIETHDQYRYKSRGWFKVKVKPIAYGVVNIQSDHSKVYRFTEDGKDTPSWANIVDMEPTEDGWVLTMFDGNKLKYTIQRDEHGNVINQ